jgi:hypothetical protein
LKNLKLSAATGSSALLQHAPAAPGAYAMACHLFILQVLFFGVIISSHNRLGIRRQHIIVTPGKPGVLRIHDVV